MAKFIVRRILLLILTMLLVSVAVFAITEASPGNIARNVLGAFITPEQEASFLAQLGLDKPMYQRYMYWLIGSDWHAKSKLGMELTRITTEQGFQEWYIKEEDGALVRWSLKGDDLLAHRIEKDGTKTKTKDNARWVSAEGTRKVFWGIDKHNHAVLWEKGTDRKVWTFGGRNRFGWMRHPAGPLSTCP
jgi:peptide/nickel transport system permease protein